MTSDFCDNAAAPPTIQRTDQNLHKIQNGFRRRHSVAKSVDGEDAPSPIKNGKCLNGKFLSPILTSAIADEVKSKSDGIAEDTLSAENLRLEYFIDHSSTSTGHREARKSGGLIDQLCSTQLVYWTMTLSFIINYFWNRRQNLRAFFVACAMLATASFFAVLFFATVIFSYFFYDLPRKMSPSPASSASPAPSYCSLREENSPSSSRRSSMVLPLPSPRLPSDDNDSSNRSDCNILIDEKPCQAKVAFDMTLGVATNAPRFKPSYDRNYWSTNDDKYMNSREDDDDDDDDEDDVDDIRAIKKLKRLVREMQLEERIAKRLRAKKSSLGAEQSNQTPEPRSSPIFGGDGRSSNYHGISVQKKISHQPMLNIPFVHDALNEFSLQSGMPNIMEAVRWKPKYCMVSATCGPREKCLKGQCTVADQSQQIFQPRPVQHIPEHSKVAAVGKSIFDGRPKFSSSGQSQLKQESTALDDSKASVVERCWFFCDIYSNYESKLPSK